MGLAPLRDLVLALSHPESRLACPPSHLRCRLQPTALTFVDNDGQAAIWGQPYTPDVVPSSQGQSVGSVAERQKHSCLAVLS